MADPFKLGAAITRAEHATPHDPHASRLDDDRLGVPVPVTRPLAVFTQDPATRKMDAAVATLDVTYEPLAPGPDGSVIRVIDENATSHDTYEPLDLDAIARYAPQGIAPSTIDPRFAQQMTYAVAMHTYDRFRQALGRTPDFAFPAARGGEPPDPAGRLKLHVYPHHRREDNAYYDEERGALLFGYTFANKSARMLNQPGGVVFTSLSHDIVAHEMTHALLSGMRAKFLLPSNADVDGFHEGFSDLIALFQRFQYTELVKRALAQSSDIASGLLTDFSRQWGQTTGDGRAPLRTALVDAGPPDAPVKRHFLYRRGREAHDLGAILLAAVFDAYRWVYAQKTARVRRLAAGNVQDRPAELVELLTTQAQRLAAQFLNILIRAIDYCPPVDLTFGEFLRALITADFDLVPEDPWGYREAFILAFRRYGITVPDVPDLSEQALLWQSPEDALPPVPGLAFAQLVRPRRPSDAPSPAELRRRAEALGRFVIEPGRRHLFGLAAPRTRHPRVEPPVVESIRSLRRIRADNSIDFDLVAEITQRRRVSRHRWFYGGSTVIIAASGEVRYAIVKHVDSERRQKLFSAHMRSVDAARRGVFEQDAPRPASLLRGLHARARK